MGLGGLRFLNNLGGAEPGAIVALSGTDFGKLLEEGGLIFAVGEVERAGVAVGKAGFTKNLQPDLAAAKRELEHFAGGLADGPDHAEVADGCSRGMSAFFKNDYGFAGLAAM